MLMGTKSRGELSLVYWAENAQFDLSLIMQMMWCWRCKMVLPMLDEEEFSVVSSLYAQGMRATKEFRQKHNIPLSEASIEDRFRPVREAYQRLTGWEEQHENAVMHHRISIYGAPCDGCGKPLRTPRASFCAACGRGVSSRSDEMI